MKQENQITIYTSNNPTPELAAQIAQLRWHSDCADNVNQILMFTSLDKDATDCFHVYACDEKKTVIAALYCVQNDQNSLKWYYGDLFVMPSYQRQGIARKTIAFTIEYLSARNATSLVTYVEPTNQASLALQKSLGFTQVEYEIFNDFINEGQLRFEYNI